MKLLAPATLFGAALASRTQTTTSFQGSCPAIKPMDNFKLLPYTGHWWNIGVSPFFWNFENSKCITVDITLDTELPNFYNLVTKTLLPSGFSSTANARGIFQAETPGLMSVSFYWEPTPGQNNYNIIDTDYENYAYIWSCIDKVPGQVGRFFGNQQRFSASLWVNVRDPNISEIEKQAHIERAWKILEEQGWDKAEVFGAAIQTVASNNCPNFNTIF